MQEGFFFECLRNDSSIRSKSAAYLRVARARNAEKILGKSLDEIVADDEMFYLALRKLHELVKNDHGSHGNALRKYYQYVNGRQFGSLVKYKKEHEL